MQGRIKNIDRKISRFLILIFFFWMQSFFILEMVMQLDLLSRPSAGSMMIMVVSGSFYISYLLVRDMLAGTVNLLRESITVVFKALLSVMRNN